MIDDEWFAVQRSVDIVVRRSMRKQFLEKGHLSDDLQVVGIQSTGQVADRKTSFHQFRRHEFVDHIIEEGNGNESVLLRVVFTEN